MERSNERGTTERSSERDRDRYEGDRRGEPSRDSSYDRRAVHGERDRRENRERGGWDLKNVVKIFYSSFVAH